MKKIFIGIGLFILILVGFYFWYYHTLPIPYTSAKQAVDYAVKAISEK